MGVKAVSLYYGVKVALLFQEQGVQGGWMPLGKMIGKFRVMYVVKQDSVKCVV